MLDVDGIGWSGLVLMLLWWSVYFISLVTGVALFDVSTFAVRGWVDAIN